MKDFLDQTFLASTDPEGCFKPLLSSEQETLPEFQLNLLPVSLAASSSQQSRQISSIGTCLVWFCLSS